MAEITETVEIAMPKPVTEADVMRRYKSLKKKRNVKHLMALAEFLEEQPEDYNQAYWWKWDQHNLDILERFFEGYITEKEVEKEINYCGAYRCIAGTSNHVAKLKLASIKIPDQGVRIKGQIVDHAVAARGNMRITRREGDFLFDANWRPANDMDVSEALRKLAEDADLWDITDRDEGGREYMKSEILEEVSNEIASERWNKYRSQAGVL
jgi:hypothetical protein